MASVIGEAIEADAPLMDSGLDSLGAVELRNSLSAAFSLNLPATVVFDYPSIEALSKYVAGNTFKTPHHQQQQQQHLTASAETTADIKQRVISIVSLVLGNDSVQEDQPFMEVRK